MGQIFGTGIFEVECWGIFGEFVLQIFGGYSELYKYEESLLDTGSAKNNPICHIEYYINLGSIHNKDLSRIEYNEHSIPLKLKYKRNL